MGEKRSHDPGAGAGVMAPLLAQAMVRMREAGADVVLAWSMDHSFNRKAFRRLGFFTLPERLRPIELHFGVRPLGDAPVTDRNNWYLSYCDSDTV